MTSTRDERIDVQRVEIDAEGYDDNGVYWGEGPAGPGPRSGVFVATQGLDEISFRAGSLKEAKAKAAEALAAERERRTALKMQHYAMEWVNPVSGEIYQLRIEHRANYFHEGLDHIEIITRSPKRAPLPITDTGYLSHFIGAAQLEAAGGPEAFVADWLKRASADPLWRRREAQKLQGDLFGWADAEAETAAKNSEPTKELPLRSGQWIGTARPSRGRRRRRTAEPERDPE
jgi:hypothetical protein